MNLQSLWLSFNCWARMRPLFWLISVEERWLNWFFDISGFNSSNFLQILMIISTTLTSIGYCIVGTYSYLRSLGYNVNSLGWIPILGLSLVIFVASLGILTLPYVIVAEVLPQKVRSKASRFQFTFSNNFPFSDKRSRKYNLYSSCNNMCFYCNQGKFCDEPLELLLTPNLFSVIPHYDSAVSALRSHVDILNDLYSFNVCNSHILTRNQRQKFS